MNRRIERREAAEILAGFRRVLIATHEKPDGDALGSALGLGRLLRDNGRQATVLLPDPLPEKFQELAGDDFITSAVGLDLQNFDGFIALDSARDSRVALGPELQLSALNVPMLNLDHHVDNSVQADWSCIAGDAAATAELVCDLAGENGWTISPVAATWLLLGLITDTGSFRFSNTTGATLRTAAMLRDCGAQWESVVNAAFFSKPLRQQRFEAAMLRDCVKSACDGRFLYALIPDELFAEYQFDMRDGETVIDLLREVKGVVIAALVYRRNGAFKLSLRSKDGRYPVGPIARTFDGGGHQMAAGATVSAGSFAEVEALLLEQVTRTLEEAHAV